MAKPGKFERSDWFFLGRDFGLRTVSMETVQAVGFFFSVRKPAILKFATKIAKKLPTWLTTWTKKTIIHQENFTVYYPKDRETSDVEN